MGRKTRIAIASELNWPLRRHLDLIAGVRDYACQHGWAVDAGRYPEVRMEAGVRFDGIVGRIEKATLKAARRAEIPAVNVWISSPVAKDLPNVLIDAFASGRMAAEHLVARGLRKLVAFVPPRRVAARQFADGVESVAREHGFPFQRCLVTATFDDSAAAWRRTVARLESFQATWTAPVGATAWHESLARAILTILQDLGWRVPDDLALVSTGNEPLVCNAIHPTMSSVDPGHYRCGFEAARLLHGLMDGEPTPSAPILVLPKELVVRGSSDVFAVRDPEVQRALRFMADNSYRSIGVADIVGATKLSRQVLERRFRDQVGTTINNQLLRLRVERLKRLLVESSTPVKELGAQAGFGTPANMFQVFKARTGLTPAAYRQQHANPAIRVT